MKKLSNFELALKLKKELLNCFNEERLNDALTCVEQVEKESSGWTGRLKQPSKETFYLLGIAGRFLADIQEYNRAKALLRKSIEMSEILFSQNDFNTFRERAELAKTEMALGNLKEFEREVQIISDWLALEDQALAKQLMLLTESEEPYKACQFGQDVIDFYELIKSEEALYNAAIWNSNVGFVRKQLGDIEGCLNNLTRAREIFYEREQCEQFRKLDLFYYATTLNNLARVYQDMQLHNEAHSIFSKAFDLAKQSCGANGEEYLHVLESVKSSAEADTGQIEIDEFIRRSELVAHIARQFGFTKFVLNSISDAEILLRFSFEIFKRIYGATHGLTLDVLALLCEILEEQAGGSTEVKTLMDEVTNSEDKRRYDSRIPLTSVPTLKQIFGSPELCIRNFGVENNKTVSELVEECVASFILSNYPKAIELGTVLMARDPSLEIYLLMLISMQCLEGPYYKEKESLIGVIAQSVDVLFQKGSRANLFAHLILGIKLIDESYVLNSVEDTCAFLYYSAWRNFLEGDTESARIALDKCRKIDVNTFEASLVQRVNFKEGFRPADSKTMQLSGQASQHLERGEFLEAYEKNLKALELAEASLPISSIEFQSTLLEGATVAYRLRDFKRAEEFYSRIVNNASNSLIHSAALSGLGSIQMEFRHYKEAENLYKQSHLKLKESGKVGGLEEAILLNNIAELEGVRGDEVAERQTYLKALGLFKGKESHSIEAARCQTNFAMSLYRTGELEEAFELASKALKVKQTLIGDGFHRNAESITSFTLLGFIELERKNFDTSENYFRKSVEIAKVIFGTSNGRYALALNNLSALLFKQKRFEEAANTQSEAVECLSGSEENHPALLQLHRNLAFSHVALRTWNQAVEILREARDKEPLQIAHTLRIRSSIEQVRLLGWLHSISHLMLTIRHHADEPTFSDSEVYSAVIQRKGLIGAMELEQRLTHSSSDSSDRLQSVISLKSKLSTLLLTEPGDEGSGFRNRLIENTEVQLKSLESELTVNTDAFWQKRFAMTDTTIKSLLAKNVVLLEYYRYKVFDLNEMDGDDHYAVFVIAKDSDTKLITLGNAKAIEELIAKYKDCIQKLNQANRSELILDLGESIRKRIFDSVEPFLEGVEQIFIAPDGELNRLPLQALPTKDGEFLIDKYHFNYLSVGSDLITAVKENVSTTLSIVIADPEFDLAQTPAGSPNIDAELDNQSILRGKFEEMRFVPLSGTKLEGEKIASLLGAELLHGRNARKQNLKKIASPRVLHFATHGYFLEDSLAEPIYTDSVEIGTLSRASRIKSALNPLLRSGLALAGANCWLNGVELPLEYGNGLISAEDICALDLRNTELVVLSACDTGLGSIKSGEGVFGLRRAFFLAGAKQVIMSLWSVPDVSTSSLMVSFYENVNDGMAVSEALRKAQLSVKFHKADPIYWGAFICQGP